MDKNTIVNAVNASHGTRLQSIDKRERDILSNIDHWQNSVTEKVRDPRAQGDGTHVGLAQMAGTPVVKMLPNLCWSPVCAGDPGQGC